MIKKCACLLFLSVCGLAQAQFVLTSSFFKNNQKILPRYTCDSKNISPDLSWRGAPKGTKSYVLILSDPEAPSGTFYHWAVFNIPAKLKALPAELEHKLLVEIDGRDMNQGTNDFGKAGYGGPCPPYGTHHYVFTLYALDVDKLDIAPDISARDVEQVLKSKQEHVLGSAQLIGLYERGQRG